MPGAGLLIYHVDETVADNKDDWHPKVMLLQVGQCSRRGYVIPTCTASSSTTSTGATVGQKVQNAIASLGVRT